MSRQCKRCGYFSNGLKYFECGTCRQLNPLQTNNKGLLFKIKKLLKWVLN